MRTHNSQITLFEQESRLCEFLIIIPLPNSIKEKVRQFKAEFGDLFGSFNSQHSIAHITICDFLVFEHRTSDVFSLLKSRLRSLDSFEVSVFGFDSFHGSNTIHLKVEKSFEFASLLNEIDFSRKILHLRKNYFQSNTPHITIAKNIPSGILDEAKRMFLNRFFETKFEVDKLQFLRFDFISRQYKHSGYLHLKGR